MVARLARDTPFFGGTGRAALALAEAVTRLADRSDPVPEAVWDKAARHYDEAALAALVVAIANINVWNRLDIRTGGRPARTSGELTGRASAGNRRPERAGKRPQKCRLALIFR